MNRSNFNSRRFRSCKSVASFTGKLKTSVMTLSASTFWARVSTATILTSRSMVIEPTGESISAVSCSIAELCCLTFRIFELYPNGLTTLFNNYVAFSACHTTWSVSNNLQGITGSIKIGIVSASGEIVNERIIEQEQRDLRSSERNFAIPDFIERELLFSQAENLLPDNSLTLSIEVESRSRSKVSINSFPRSYSVLGVQDFETSRGNSHCSADGK